MELKEESIVPLFPGNYKSIRIRMKLFVRTGNLTFMIISSSDKFSFIHDMSSGFLYLTIFPGVSELPFHKSFYLAISSSSWTAQTEYLYICILM